MNKPSALQTDVIKAGADAYAAAKAAAIAAGKTQDEADVAGKIASLEARKALLATKALVRE